MRYIYNGAYRQFRGYVFTAGKPVTITDRGTLELIKHEPDFTEVPDEQAQIQAPAAPEVLEVPKTNSKGKECIKCHKLIPRGWYMHQKWCKG
jgi:hypothetical protein